MITSDLRPTPPSASTLLGVAIFFLIGIALVTCSWPAIETQNFEVGDFAANSVLIQKAKHLALFKGNYSRIGVNHPGPAILYVLAFGEWLFHDVLHLANSPFSGQLVGVCFYTAFWTVLMFRESRKLYGSLENALVAVSVFLVILACFHPSFFTGIWFPDLYVFPFAVMTMAMARLASGAADSLLTLALSAGFLINGHVSFLSTVGAMFVIVVLLNALSQLKSPQKRIIGRSFLVDHRGTVCGAILLLALFFVPLGIETYRDYPGPVASYLEFGSQQTVHPLDESLLFVAGYWGGVAPAIGAVAAAILAFMVARRVAAIRAGVASLMIALIASTAALLVYARYGIDHLEFDYLGYFYYTTPALLFPAVVVAALTLEGGMRRLLAAITACVLCLAATYRQVDRPVPYIAQYNQPNVVAAYNAIKQAAGDGRVVLDVDDRRGWGYLWTTLVGVEAYAIRRNENLFCLNKHWHILFTKAAACTSSELEQRSRYIVDVGPAVRKEPPTFEAAGMLFYRHVLPDITDLGSLPVASNANLFNDYLLVSGWSPPEGEYVWSQGSESRVTFRVRPGFAGVVVLDCGAFLTPAHPVMTGHVFMNDLPAGSFEITTEHGRRSLAFPLPSGGGVVDLRIVMDNPVSPASVGAGSDPRLLGISLYGLQVKPS